MFTNTLRKIASKIVMATMLFSALAPMAASPMAVADTPTGNLTVGFNHADGGYTIKNVTQQVVADRDAQDCSLQGSGPYAGYFVCQELLPIGTYTVTFDDVTGFQTPEVAHINLNETGATVMGDYIAEGVQPTGVLGINVNHADGGYFIKDVQQQIVADRDVSSCGPLQQNGYYLCTQSLPAGTYTVIYKDVQGYDKPTDDHVLLDLGGATVYGDYTLPGPAMADLTVGVNLAEGGFTIENVTQQIVADVSPASSCGPVQPSGYYMCGQSLPIGTYTVKFKSVSGFDKPDDIHVDLNQPGGTVWGTYTAQGPASGNLIVGVNLAEGGYDIYNVTQQLVATVDPVSGCPLSSGYYMCSQQLPVGTYTVKFKSVSGYITPSDIHVNLDEIGGTVWGYYSTIPTGVITVSVVDQFDHPILTLPANEWQLKRCTSANPASCTDVVASGGPGGVYDNLSFFTYRIVFPNPQLPPGYSGRTVIPSVYQVLDAQHTSLQFKIKYTTEIQSSGEAYVNVRTTPVKANVRMTTVDPPQAQQEGVTSDLVAASTYDLSDPDRFTLPTLVSGWTAPTDYYIECLPAPGGYHAPANPIQHTDEVYAKDSENLAGICQYTQVPPNEKVTISIDTLGVEYAAIYVDNVEVRPTTSDAEVFVTITTTENHNISFEDKDPGNYAVPPDIAIPAGTLDSTMTPAQLKYLGYYVPYGNLAVAEVNTENEDGLVYLTIGSDPTKWLVGHADTTPIPLIVHFDETIDHEFHFQDRNPPASPAYYLRAVPVSDPGFAVLQDITLNGSNITHFQEYYSYAGPQTLSNNVQLVGDYIAESDAAFFRARTTNGAPIIGDIYLDINGEPTETIDPSTQQADPGQWTRIFISDVVNDTDTTAFESPILGGTYVANPTLYDLTTFSPGPLVNDLESTYEPISSVSNLIVQLLPAGVGSAGLPVVLDSSVTEFTVLNGATYEATFDNVDPNPSHIVTCPTINGYISQGDIYIPGGTLVPGDNTVGCYYVPDNGNQATILIQTEATNDPDLEAPITMNINGNNYFVGWTQSTNPNNPATLEVVIDTTDTNIIVYGDVTGYVTPAQQLITGVTPGTHWMTDPGTNIFTGTYVPQGTGADLIFHLRQADPVQTPVTNTDVTVVTTTQQTDGSGDTTFTGVDTNQVIDVTFGVHPMGSGAYVTPLPLQFQAGELQDGQVYEFYIYYVPVGNDVTLDIQTLDEPTQLINVNGAINLVVNGGPATLLGFGTASVIVSNDTNLYSYEIDWEDTYPASQYVTPLDDPHTVDLTGITQGEIVNVDGLYRLCVSGNCEYVTITAWDETGSNILTTVDITVDSVVVSTNGQYVGYYDVGAVLNVEFEDVTTHGVPEIFHNAVSQGFSHTTQYTVLDGPLTNNVDAYYPLEANTVGFNVGTQDNQSNPLTEDITHGITGTETTEATPAFFVVSQTDLANYIINFADKPGYITPGPIVVSGQAIASIPPNVTITDNGVPYVPGTQLVLGDTYDIVATYIPHFTIQKNIIQEQTIVNNNKRVDYQIVVTRHPDTAPGQLSIILHDTISDNSRTLTGTNGGTMSVVPQNGSYSTCSNGCGDITAGSVQINTSNPGAVVTITYQTLSNNSSIPTGQSSNFTNTLTGSYNDGGQQVNVTTGATVNVLAPPTSGPTPPPSGGGGGGGGHLLIKGDMILEITKLVSLNKSNWVDASDEEDPLVIRERYNGPLYTKVTVKNLGQVTATNIRFSEGFDEGDSKITSDEIENVQGEEGFEYNEVTGEMKIDKLTVGGEIEFSYEQDIDENGSQGELAEEYLVLEGFSTKLSASQDGLVKHGIGDHYPSWLTAGQPDTPYEGNLLELSITTDKAAARVGEEVTYKITAKNNADFDFTGVVITWNYDENALEILNPFGGRDNGTEIHWDRGILRPGQTVEYQVRTRVKDTAPVGGNVRTVARGLVNELENPATADHYLTIIAGIGDDVDLAQTGMSTFMLILATIFSYFAYTRTGRRRYLALKKAALRPL